MTLYEHVFIARPEISPTRAQKLIDEIGDIVSKQGGQVGKTEYWGLRQLAYPIKKSSKGHYMLLNITAEHSAISEMERQMKLNDDIIRFLTLKVKTHDDSQSAPIRQKEKEWSEDDDGRKNDSQSASTRHGKASSSVEKDKISIKEDAKESVKESVKENAKDGVKDDVGGDDA